MSLLTDEISFTHAICLQAAYTLITFGTVKENNRKRKKDEKEEEKNRKHFLYIYLYINLHWEWFERFLTHVFDCAMPQDAKIFDFSSKCYKSFSYTYTYTILSLSTLIFNRL